MLLNGKSSLEFRSDMLVKYTQGRFFYWWINLLGCRVQGFLGLISKCDLLHLLLLCLWCNPPKVRKLVFANANDIMKRFQDLNWNDFGSRMLLSLQILYPELEFFTSMMSLLLIQNWKSRFFFKVLFLTFLRSGISPIDYKEKVVRSWR